MQPTLAAGDLVVTKRERASAARGGDIVTFADPSRRGDLVTHRVVEIRSRASRLAFVTRGDANTGVERWSIARDGFLGRHVARVPHAGYVVAWLGLPAVRLGFVAVASALLGGLALRRIWAS